MGIRVTEISTPFGGVAWEYTDKKEMPAIPPLAAGRKINVFVSSKCGDKGKYDHVRAELKKAIETTGIADVYLFEDEGAASMSAGAHYVYALEDSDICIFLIDNADGVPPGVQKEIDTVRKNNIKALYYFCDETSKEETAVQQGLKGAQYEKSTTIHKFDDLIQNGAKDLINDIIATYHHYCKGRLIWKPEEESEPLQHIEISGTEPVQLETIPKSVLKSIDRCKDYILKFSVGKHMGKAPDEDEKTSDIDDWCVQFLPILFEGRSIKQFNTAMFLESVKALQSDEFFQIVQLRWQAIQAYFMGDIAKCVEHLDSALKLAKETNQPTWVIKDLLVDRRNQHWMLCTVNNQYFESEAQKELTESDEELYYPLLDRIHESLHEKYIEGFYKKKTESPYSVTIGGNLDSLGELLASSFVISMYNGSLSHILLFYDKIRDIVFYLSNKYSDWQFRRLMLQFAVFAGKEKEIKGLKDSYPEILNQVTADDAIAVMDFCNNHPIKHKRISSQLLGFGAVGYYLNDSDYAKYEALIVDEIKSWLGSDTSVLDVGGYIFKGLSGIAHRISQDTLAEICCLFIDKHYSRWYIDMFKFIGQHMDLREMKLETAKSLIAHIMSVFDDEQERKLIQYSATFLCVLRKQMPEITNELDAKVSEHFPKYYSGVYLLETTENEQQDLPGLVKGYVEEAQKTNATQGQNGVYFGHGTRTFATIRSIFRLNDVKWDNALMDAVITTAADTLLVSKEGIHIKLDAVSLLVCIALKFPEHYNRNKATYDLLREKREEIETADISIISSNVDRIALEIGLCFLYTAMGEDVYLEILDLLLCIQNDIPTTIAVASMVNEYLTSTDSVVLPQPLGTIVLQNVLQWLRSEHLDIRYIATKILLRFSCEPENESVVNRQIINLVDSECIYIKNLIVNRIYTTKGIWEKTRDYVVSKCENDECFIVRKVCAEQKKLHSPA